jgi:hypothetical protein
MGVIETLILYLIAGLAVAFAVYLADRRAPGWQRLFQPATAVFFWPLYIPLLLSRGERESEDAIAAPGGEDDSMSAAIGQVEAELARALGSLDGWAEDVLAREKGRIEELVRAWKAQAARIREMDRALAGDDGAQRPRVATFELVEATERWRKAAESRQRNLQKLADVRRRAHEDLLGTLAWVRELVSMIQLAKFTGAPATRAGELVAQIAASVEGLSEVTRWTDADAPRAIAGS